MVGLPEVLHGLLNQILDLMLIEVVVVVDVEAGEHCIDCLLQLLVTVWHT